METFVNQASEFTPHVVLDADNNIFTFTGFSRPEDVRTFYTPILNWFEDFESEIGTPLFPERYKNEPMLIEMKLNYFNSASAKFLLDVLMQINRIYMKGIKLDFKWYYEDGDDEILDSGEELAEMVDFEFDFIAYED